MSPKRRQPRPLLTVHGRTYEIGFRERQKQVGYVSKRPGRRTYDRQRVTPAHRFEPSGELELLISQHSGYGYGYTTVGRKNGPTSPGSPWRSRPRFGLQGAESSRGGAGKWGSTLSDSAEVDGYGAEHLAEYGALCEINARVRRVTVELAYPGVLGTLLGDLHWEITGYRGTGAFALDNGAYQERDWLQMLLGHDRGDGRFKYIGSANPPIASRWHSFVDQAMTSLGGNPEWEMLVRAWLERVAEQPGDIDVVLWIYNPCDLIQTVIYGWPDELAQWEPCIKAVARFPDGSRSVAQGRLYANSTGGAPGFHHYAYEVYRDPVSWMTTRYDGTTWTTDLELVRRLGLRYMMLEITSDHPGPPAPEGERGLWLVEDGQATRYSSHGPEFVTAWQLNTYGGKLVTLRDFLATYRYGVNVLRIEYLDGADVRR